MIPSNHNVVVAFMKSAEARMPAIDAKGVALDGRHVNIVDRRLSVDSGFVNVSSRLSTS